MRRPTRDELIHAVAYARGLCEALPHLNETITIVDQVEALLDRPEDEQ